MSKLISRLVLGAAVLVAVGCGDGDDKKSKVPDNPLELPKGGPTGAPSQDGQPGGTSGAAGKKL